MRIGKADCHLSNTKYAEIKQLKYHFQASINILRIKEFTNVRVVGMSYSNPILNLNQVQVGQVSMHPSTKAI